jgi:hypothetical protein
LIKLYPKCMIIGGEKCYHAVGHVVRKDTWHAIRVGLYKTIIRPSATHGVEPWTLMNKIETALNVWVKANVIPVQAPGAPGFSDIGHMKVGMFRAFRTGRLYPKKSPWYSFPLEADSIRGP